jgi:hypothetical protein
MIYIRNDNRIFVLTLKGRDYSEYVSVDGMIIMERILGKQGVKVWIKCIWLRIGTCGGLF